MQFLGRCRTSARQPYSSNILNTINVKSHESIEDALRLIEKGNVFLNGLKLPPSSPLSAECPPSSSCQLQNFVDNVLVVGQGRPSLPEDRPRIVSPTSVLCSSALTPPSKYVSDEHQLSSPLSHYYDQNSNTSQLSYDNVVKPLASLEYVANRANSHDFDLDYTHLICSHNIDDFGADVAYGKNASVASSSTLGSTKLKLRPDFSFIDDIYESVKAEIGAEKACSSVQLVASSPANIAFDAPETPVITLAVDKPVTIVAEDGKEYKVVLQAVKEKANAPIRRKSSTSSVGFDFTSTEVVRDSIHLSIPLKNAPKVKRAPGVTLANMTIEEINERKRRQNRAAAQRYRQKQKCVKDAGKEEQDRLQKRNSYLRIEATRLQDEINGLRRQILESLANR
ncbi:basic region leucine zipper [Dictyocaulus viviparus]|uniref:Basic region leucine zipper n=1 Tax=Dictyocaulus viviparus TaxID=29172 RepID=A0A0D8YBP9_DICVI|nr:basic region leucine zipper [Dictyocaulus viviparus]